MASTISARLSLGEVTTTGTSGTNATIRFNPAKFSIPGISVSSRIRSRSGDRLSGPAPRRCYRPQSGKHRPAARSTIAPERDTTCIRQQQELSWANTYSNMALARINSERGAASSPTIRTRTAFILGNCWRARFLTLAGNVQWSGLAQSGARLGAYPCN